ncbi:MAG: aldehyde ferredoxin oxidoreductase N-terminal domain-containing protein, partial [Actinomycetota bacterium]|nr:aldehyde ferredoxin oxidoreductase N-terminal domain-containing protein [Actinomycetota bacterium]
MIGGYMGKFLWVDLGSNKITEEKIDLSLMRNFIGGYGIASKIIYERQKKGIDPLGEENILGILAGPLTGTSLPVVSRYTVVGKSPLTGLW